MYSAIIARNIFIVNAVHTVLQDLLLPPGQPKLSVTTTDRLVLWYPISHKIYEGISYVFLRVHAWIFTLHEHENSDSQVGNTTWPLYLYVPRTGESKHIRLKCYRTQWWEPCCDSHTFSSQLQVNGKMRFWWWLGWKCSLSATAISSSISWYLKPGETDIDGKNDTYFVPGP